MTISILTTRVPGLPIRDCARGCNNCNHTWPQINTIVVTEKILFEHFCLVLGMSTFGPWVNCPYAPTTPTVQTTLISRFMCNFFPQMAPHFCIHRHSPCNLAESRSDGFCLLHAFFQILLIMTGISSEAVGDFKFTTPIKRGTATSFANLTEQS